MSDKSKIRNALEVKAKSLGIPFNAQWKDETLREKINEAEQGGTIDSNVKYKSMHNGVLCVGVSTKIKPGEAVSLDKKTLELKSTKHAIKIGVLVAV